MTAIRATKNMRAKITFNIRMKTSIKAKLDSANTNNKINSKKITKPILVFQLLLGGNTS